MNKKWTDTDIYWWARVFGLWFSQHFTTRLEFRYQTYEADWYTGPKDINLATASLSMGYLL